MSLQQLYVALLAAGLVVLVSIVATRVASRVGLPSLLLFLALGVVLGEDVLGIEFNDAQLAQNLGTAALAVILIEGGLTTRWSDIRSVVAPAGVLASAGIGVSTTVTAVGAHYLVDLGWQQALLIGAIVASTDAAAVFSILRVLPLSGRVGRPAGGGVRLQRRAQRHPRAAVQLDAVSPFRAGVRRPAALRARRRRRDRPGCGLAWRGRACPGSRCPPPGSTRWRPSGWASSRLPPPAPRTPAASLPPTSLRWSWPTPGCHTEPRPGPSPKALAWLAQIGSVRTARAARHPAPAASRAVLPALVVGLVLLLAARPLAVAASLARLPDPVPRAGVPLLGRASRRRADRARHLSDRARRTEQRPLAEHRVRPRGDLHLDPGTESRSASSKARAGAQRGDARQSSSSPRHWTSSTPNC